MTNEFEKWLFEFYEEEKNNRRKIKNLRTLKHTRNEYVMLEMIVEQYKKLKDKENE